MAWKKADVTTKINDKNSLGPWMHLANVQERIGRLGSAMIVNAHHFNNVSPVDFGKDIDDVHDALEELRKSYNRAYSSGGPGAH